MILHADLMLPRPWNPMEREDLGSRVWVRVRGEESSGGRLRELGEGVCPGEGVRERDLNVVGPNPTNSG